MEAPETIDPANLANPAAPSYLDEDMSGVDTSMPVIKGPLTAEVEIIDVVEAESNDKTGMNLVIRMKTIKDHVSTKGDTINAGFPLRKYIGLTPVVGRPGKNDYDADSIRRGIAQFLEAVEGKKGFAKPLERFKGMRVMVKITIAPATEKYPNESNNVSFVKRG